MIEIEPRLADEARHKLKQWKRSHEPSYSEIDTIPAGLRAGLPDFSEVLRLWRKQKHPLADRLEEVVRTLRKALAWCDRLAHRAPKYPDEPANAYSSVRYQVNRLILLLR